MSNPFNDAFRGVLWKRDSIDGKHRCIIVGMLVSDEPFDLPNQALVNCNAHELVEAVRAMPYRDDSTPLGTADFVLMRLNEHPFVD